VNARTEAAFSVLMGLDPVRVGPVPAGDGQAQPACSAGEIDADTEACIARIIATSRRGAPAAPARPGSRWTGAAQLRRTRYGAIGLVASAAIAVITTLLWASPSAGAPPDQAITVPTPVSQVHSSRPT